jgi:hypothetical protein
MTKTAIWLPLALIAAVALGVTGLFTSGNHAEAQGPSVSVTAGSASVAPGGNVTVDLVVAASGVTLGALDVTVDFDDTLLSNPGCSVAGTPGTAVCNPAVDANTMSFGVINLSGINGDIGDISFTAGATEGPTTLTVTITTCGDDQGGDISANCSAVNGTITIAQATATPTTAPTTAAPTTAAPTGATTAAATTPAGTTPAGLPQTGGEGDGSGSIGWILAALGVAGAAAAAWATMRLRRVRA